MQSSYEGNKIATSWKSIDLTRCCKCSIPFTDLPKRLKFIPGDCYHLQNCCGGILCILCYQAERDKPGGAGVVEAKKASHFECPLCHHKKLPFDDMRVLTPMMQRLAEEKHPNALHQLGLACFGGMVVSNNARHGDIKKGIRYMEAASDAGSEAARVFLGDWYSVNVPDGQMPDYVKAKYWYDRCPTHYLAQRGLGYAYREGQGGLPIDMAKSTEFFLKAAEQGDPHSIVCYVTALTRQFRVEEALEWSIKGGSDETLVYKDSVANNQLNAARMCCDVKGDLRQAMFWATRARQNGSPSAKALIDYIETKVGRQCGCCRKQSPDLRCGGCKAISYCSASCQRDDWKRHKKDCKNIPEVRTS
jgi:hypothetical protein